MAHRDPILGTYPLGIPAKFLSVISCRTGIEFSSYYRGGAIIERV